MPKLIDGEDVVAVADEKSIVTYVGTYVVNAGWNDSSSSVFSYCSMAHTLNSLPVKVKKVPYTQVKEKKKSLWDQKQEAASADPNEVEEKRKREIEADNARRYTD